MAEHERTPTSTHGILDPHAGLERFSLSRVLPSAELARFVDWFWIVTWNREGATPFEQEVLPHPCANLVVEGSGTTVHGLATKRYVARLEGRGRVVGAKFRPEGFFPFSRVPMRALVSRVIAVREALGPDAAVLEAADLADANPREVIATLEETLGRCAPNTSSAGATLGRVGRLVAMAREDRSIARAEQLAEAAGTSVRSLHRLFERYVGVGPKWIIRRARVHEAAEHVAGGQQVDWARLAQDLGYHDQSHFVRDFKDQMGTTPARYAERCRRAAPGGGNQVAHFYNTDQLRRATSPSGGK